MSDHFHVRLEQPALGSLPVTLTTHANALSFNVSQTPYDSLSDLVSALITTLLTDPVHISVRWNTEPVEYEFHFDTDGSAITFTISQWPDSTRSRKNSQTVFIVRGSRMQLVLPFWRALRQLESHRSERWEWQHPFPSSDMGKLDKHIQRVKHE